MEVLIKSMTLEIKKKRVVHIDSIADPLASGLTHAQPQLTKASVPSALEKWR